MTRRERSFAIAAGAVAALLAVAYLTPHVLTVMLLAFAGVVLAVLLDALTELVRGITRLPRPAALLLAGLLVLGALGGLALVISPHLAEQVPDLAERLPGAWSRLREILNNYLPLQSVLAQLPAPSEMVGSGILGELTAVFSNTAAGLFDILVILFIAVYLVADPERYRALGLRAMPAERRDWGSELTGTLGRELRHWLAGRLISMTIVGITTATGLWLLGMPLALTLGLLAGLLSFVPYLGPVLGLVPAVLVALGESLTLVGWVAGLYVAVQAFEGYVLTPLIQQRAVALPPAVLVVAQLLGGVLAGPLGVLFAAPLLVVIATALRHLNDPMPPG